MRAENSKHVVPFLLAGFLVLLLIPLVSLYAPSLPRDVLRSVAIVLAFPLFAVGFGNWAENKGRSSWCFLWAAFPVPGFLVMALLRDKNQGTPPQGTTPLKPHDLLEHWPERLKQLGDPVVQEPHELLENWPERLKQLGNLMVKEPLARKPYRLPLLGLVFLAVCVTALTLIFRYKTAAYGQWTFRYDRFTKVVYMRSALNPKAQWVKSRFVNLEQALTLMKTREEQQRQQEIDELREKLDKTRR